MCWDVTIKIHQTRMPIGDVVQGVDLSFASWVMGTLLVRQPAHALLACSLTSPAAWWRHFARMLKRWW